RIDPHQKKKKLTRPVVQACEAKQQEEKTEKINAEDGENYAIKKQTEIFVLLKIV
uniref:Uncharacterized protein n=1 Tax=Varanus komodoensis TaxID=61221 RepID=A0A8D2J7D9_VARKO